MLRSQINPHFLYNTLELVRSCARTGEYQLVDPIVTAMGKMFRYSITGEPVILFAKEIEIVKSYISIQQARFKDRFTVIYHFAEDTYSVPVIKMLLQPVVENAILHGLEGRARDGVLFIGAAVDQGELVITVRDNGVGISPDRLASINDQLGGASSDINNHLGLYNISARLRLHYGKDCGLTVASRPDDGTCVVIRLPIDGQADGKER